ncbi:hypothetical protein LEMLEM_LOCUS17406 [Lemmus lemmus]
MAAVSSWSWPKTDPVLYTLSLLRSALPPLFSTRFLDPTVPYLTLIKGHFSPAAHCPSSFCHHNPALCSSKPSPAWNLLASACWDCFSFKQVSSWLKRIQQDHSGR